jgi:hypothetical protein
MSRFTSQITLMQDNLLMSTRDWASWDDMYTFVVDSNPAFAAKNLPDDVIKYLKLNYVLLVDKKNSLKYSTAFDLCSGVRGALPGAMAAVGAWASGRLGAAGDGRKRCLWRGRRYCPAMNAVSPGECWCSAKFLRNR